MCGELVLPVLALRAEGSYPSGSMTFDRLSRARASALRWPAIVFFAATQLLLTFAPLMERELDPNGRAHVEATGTSSHHAHNPSDCAACAARTVLSPASHTPQPALESFQPLLPELSTRDEHLDFLSKSSSRPRAPPFRQA